VAEFASATTEVRDDTNKWVPLVSEARRRGQGVSKGERGRSSTRAGLEGSWDSGLGRLREREGAGRAGKRRSWAERLAELAGTEEREKRFFFSFFSMLFENNFLKTI